MLSGLKSVLEFPAVYDWVQRILGGRNVQRCVVNHHLRPEPHHRLLDIGCGPAQILETLPQVEYVGVDLNPRYIASAQVRYGDRGSFVCQSVTQMATEKMHTFDLVMAHGLIHHLDDDEARQLFAVAAKAMKPGGRFVTLDGCFAEKQSRIARWMLSNDRGQFIRTEDAYLDLARRTFSNVQSTIRHDLLLTPYTHIIMECTNPRSAHAIE